MNPPDMHVTMEGCVADVQVSTPELIGRQARPRSRRALLPRRTAAD